MNCNGIWRSVQEGTKHFGMQQGEAASPDRATATGVAHSYDQNDVTGLKKDYLRKLEPYLNGFSKTFGMPKIRFELRHCTR
ncbi:hypothetical protein C7B76_20755 [filamentous cyanobacterium CCP2]|nr:hypothetical protein C7B76_20755 [filamentous cyanobacterium CCP2]